MGRGSTSEATSTTKKLLRRLALALMTHVVNLKCAWVSCLFCCRASIREITVFWTLTSKIFSVGGGLTPPLAAAPHPPQAS